MEVIVALEGVVDGNREDINAIRQRIGRSGRRGTGRTGRAAPRRVVQLLDMDMEDSKTLHDSR
jgi:hypothetical protein